MTGGTEGANSGAGLWRRPVLAAVVMAFVGVSYLFRAWWPSLIGFAPDKTPLPNPLPNVLLLIPCLVSFLLLRERIQDRLC